MILFSKTVNSTEALEIGLVNKVVPPEQLMEASLALAERLSERPPIAVGCVLKAISTGIYEGLDKGLKIEKEGTGIVRQTEDCKEGFAAFIEKRSPVFKGC
jgi:enoyl-CoA hydratase/carnithine racemase